MTNEERDIITQFIGRVGGGQGAAPVLGGSVPATTGQPALPPVDREADQLLQTLFQRYPDARYRITQLAFVQEHALVEAQNRIKRLEWEVQQAQQAAQQASQQADRGRSGGGLFGGLFGGGNRPQSPPPGGAWGGGQQGFLRAIRSTSAAISAELPGRHVSATRRVGLPGLCAYHGRRRCGWHGRWQRLDEHVLWRPRNGGWIGRRSQPLGDRCRRRPGICRPGHLGKPILGRVVAIRTTWIRDPGISRRPTRPGMIIVAAVADGIVAAHLPTTTPSDCSATACGI